jgi:hypothetical protein
MNKRRSTLALVLAGALASALLLCHSPARADSRYWSWGWGLYGLRERREPLDNARFDWTYVLFGNVDAPDQVTIDRANEVLKLNPEHGFLIRVWPIMHLGDCPENRFQASLFHYLYHPGVRERVLAETRRQVEFVLQKLDRPENVLGATFLEELPAHFTSAPLGSEWNRWKMGDPLPWDIRRFHKQIARDLGEPFDLRNPRHRRWWGKKYVQVLGEIHRVMKQSLGERPVFYYQHPLVRALDDVRADGSKARNLDLRTLPIRYRELVGPGLADGMFEYPVNREMAERQHRTAIALGDLVFSQVSIPAAMRLVSLQDMTELARWKYDGNLGTFLFPTNGRPTIERGYDDQTYGTSTDLIRRFAWDNRINLEIVARELSPVVSLDYDVNATEQDGFFRIRAQIWNRRDSSWFGGRYDLATLQDVRVTLRLPVGFYMAGGDGVSAVFAVGNIGPQDGRAMEWRVRAEGDRAVIHAGQFFSVTAEAADGTKGESVSSESQHRIPHLRLHVIARSGERWLEPTFGLASDPPSVELKALGDEIDSPMLARTGIERVLYRGTLSSTTRLIIGPGTRAVLLPVSIFDERTSGFHPHPRGPDGTVEFNEGYLIYGAVGPAVRSGERYRFRLTGRTSGGGNCLAHVRFTGMEEGKERTKDIEVPLHSLTGNLTTVESQDVEVPSFDGGRARMALAFYRRGGSGTLFLRSFDGYRSDIPARGLDVSDRLVGSLPSLASPATLLTYYDRSAPEDGLARRASVRFLSSREASVP